MKNFLLLIFILVCFQTKAMNAGAIACSFEENSEVAMGSEQWVDVQIFSGYMPSDSIIIYIAHINELNNPEHGLKLFKEKVSGVFVNRPFNPDGVSRRVYFFLPAVYETGKFQISANLTQKFSAVFPNNTTSILSSEITKKQGTMYLYTLNGYFIQSRRTDDQIPIPQGFYIFHVLFDDKSSTSGKAYIQ